MMFYFQSLSLVAALFATPAAAWPTGAGSCPLNAPAVGGSHMANANLVAGSLEEAPQSLMVMVDGTALTPDTAAMVTAGESVEVQLMGESSFRGFLIRLGPNDDTTAMERSGVDLTTALNPVSADDVKLEEMYCIPAGVAGVCHTAQTDKTMVAATLEVPEEFANEDMTMDVTVVIVNNADMSEYYHTSYMIKATAATEEPPTLEDATTDPPEDATTEQPAAAPAEPPAPEPVPAPVPAPSPDTSNGIVTSAASAVLMGVAGVAVALV